MAVAKWIFKLAQMATILSFASQSYAISSSATDSEEPTDENSTGVQKLQLNTFHSPSFGLTLSSFAELLTGRKLGDVDVKSVFGRAQFDLPDSCQLGNSSERSFRSGGAMVTYPLFCAGYEVDGAGVVIFLWNDLISGAKLQLVQSDALADSLSRAQTPESSSTLLQLVDASDEASVSKPMWRWLQSDWRLASSVVGEDANGLKTERFVDASTGEILKTLPWSFHAVGRALVFEKNDAEIDRQWKPLLNLSDNGYLDGNTFQIFAPDENSSRVHSDTLEFAHEPGEGAAFDQVQTYSNITRGLTWLESNMGFDMQGAKVIIRVNSATGSDKHPDPENAEYIPATDLGAAEIKLGAGGNKLHNLGRDSDVVLHEFGHHVVYQHISTRERGAALALHEGFADFIAYGINGDPYLAETVLPGKAYLRTAMLDADRRFDNPYMRADAHNRGEVWSAMLWTIREKVGHSFDKVVARSLEYLDKNADFQDALLALLSADRDIQPLALGNHEFGLFGTAKCEILQTAVERGYQQFLQDVDGSSCGLNLAEIEDHAFSAPADAVGEPDTSPVTVFGVNCGVVGNSSTANTHQGLALFLLLAPLFAMVWLRRSSSVEAG